MSDNKIFVVKQTYNARTKLISGNVSFTSNNIHYKCQKILDKYLKGDKVSARKNAFEICKNKPNSLAAAQLITYILYSDGRFDEAYSEVKKNIVKNS